MPTAREDYQQHSIHCPACARVDMHALCSRRCLAGLALLEIAEQADIAEGRRMPNDQILRYSKTERST